VAELAVEPRGERAIRQPQPGAPGTARKSG